MGSPVFHTDDVQGAPYIPLRMLYPSGALFIECFIPPSQVGTTVDVHVVAMGQKAMGQVLIA